jgi:hypothetical protein
MSKPLTDNPDVDQAIEQAWDNLYARLDVLQPKPAHEVLEQQAHAIIRSLALELKTAGDALVQCAEWYKFHGQGKLANQTILLARKAREVAESVLG